MKAAFAQSVLDSANGLFDEIIDIEAAGGRRRLSGTGVAISYTGVRRIDGTDTAEADSADLLQQSTEALKTAVDDGSFLSTLQAADTAFAAVTVDVAATQTAIADAVLEVIVTTPGPTASPTTPQPTSGPTATPGGSAGDGEDGGGAIIIIVVVVAVVVVLALAGAGAYVALRKKKDKGTNVTPVDSSSQAPGTSLRVMPHTPGLAEAATAEGEVVIAPTAIPLASKSLPHAEFQARNFCPTCGNVLASGANFCMGCGNALPT